MQPPLLPAETLERVMRRARLDGTGVLALASAFALASAVVGDVFGAGIGLLVAGAGAVELHGAGLLRGGEIRGVRWLVGSQVYLLVVMLGYVGFRLVSYDATLINYAVTTDTRRDLIEMGYDDAAIARLVEKMYYITYVAVGVVTLVYQGGLAIYYHRRRAALATALAAE